MKYIYYYVIISNILNINKQINIIDLKAFERRLTEVIASIKPITNRWRSKSIFTF